LKKLTLIALFSILVSGLACSLLCSLVLAETQKELFDRGVARLKDNQFQQAVDAFSQLIRMAPESPDAHKNRGVAYMKLGKYDLAIQDFNTTRKILPDMKGLYSNLGVAWYYKGEYTKAIENYDKEIDLTPDNHYAFFNRAICRVEINDLTLGLEDVNQAIALLPDFYLAHCLRGDLLVKMGKQSLARQAYQRAVEIDPDLDYAKAQLASLPQAPDAPAPENGPSAHAYELQAGAYQVKENALGMEQTLKDRGYGVRILELTRPDNTRWYLVRIGGFDTRSAANAAKKEFIANQGMDIIVRPWGKF